MLSTKRPETVRPRRARTWPSTARVSPRRGDARTSRPRYPGGRAAAASTSACCTPASTAGRATHATPPARSTACAPGATTTGRWATSIEPRGGLPATRGSSSPATSRGATSARPAPRGRPWSRSRSGEAVRTEHRDARCLPLGRLRGRRWRARPTTARRSTGFRQALERSWLRRPAGPVRGAPRGRLPGARRSSPPIRSAGSGDPGPRVRFRRRRAVDREGPLRDPPRRRLRSPSTGTMPWAASCHRPRDCRRTARGSPSSRELRRSGEAPGRAVRGRRRPGRPIPGGCASSSLKSRTCSWPGSSRAPEAPSLEAPRSLPQGFRPLHRPPARSLRRRQGLHVVFGPNKAGKSSALRALKALLYGFAARTGDNFSPRRTTSSASAAVCAYSDGSELEFLRRKGTEEHPPRARTTRARWTTASSTAASRGSTRSSSPRLFGIDHDGPVAGGQELLDQHGDVGQALFAAGLGTRNLRKVLAIARRRGRRPVPPARPKARINQAIADFGRRTGARRGLAPRPRVGGPRKELERKREESDAWGPAEIAGLKPERTRLAACAPRPAAPRRTAYLLTVASWST